jgi:hypothetical protein
LLLLECRGHIARCASRNSHLHVYTIDPVSAGLLGSGKMLLNNRGGSQRTRCNECVSEHVSCAESGFRGAIEAAKQLLDSRDRRLAAPLLPAADVGTV